MTYFVLDNQGNRFGPYTIEELEHFIVERRVLENTVLVNSNTEERVFAKDILQFQNPNIAPHQMASQTPYQMPNSNYYHNNQSQNNNFILIIVSFILIVFFPLAGIIHLL